MNELRTLDPNITSTLLLYGDMKRLKPEEKNEYYLYRCQLIGVDPASRPFDLLNLNGKEILYPNAGCAQQLTSIHGLSHRIVGKDKFDDAYVITTEITDKHGRTTQSMGAVNIGGLKNEALGNALMKCHTKSLRRGIFSHCGLGMLDETEIETIPGATTVKWESGSSPIVARETPQVVAASEAEEWTNDSKDVLEDLLGQGFDLMRALGMSEDQIKKWEDRYRGKVELPPSKVFFQVGESIEKMQRKLDKSNPDAEPPDEKGSTKDAITRNWQAIIQRWRAQGMNEVHIGNKVKKLTSEWIGDEKRFTPESDAKIILEQNVLISEFHT